MTLLPRLRLAGALLLVLLLTACAGPDVIRGRLNYDLRPAAERTDIFWPAAPDAPHYRYLGQLVGQPNFEERTDKKRIGLVTAFKWIVGLFEVETTVLLRRPQHGAVSDSGRIYVVDAGRNAVVVFDPNGPPEEEEKAKKAKEQAKEKRAKEQAKTQDNEEAEDVDGQMLLWEFVGPKTRFAGPVAVAILGNGEIAVSDAILGVVARLDAKGVPIGSFGVGQLKRPTGLAFDPERGLLFVADTIAQDIKVFDRSAKLVNTFGAPGDGPGQFNAPTHLAFSHGRLYVTDTFNTRIQVFEADGRRVREFGERGLNIGDLVRPKGVAVGDAGIVYVVESYYGRLLVFNEKSQLLLDIDGSGLKGDKFTLPAGVWTDRQGRIFVADMANGRIVMFQFLNP